MATPEATHKIYHAHRESQRERILETAKALFLRDGIDNVSLAQIAKGARLSRVTLYEYFPDKQEVAWAVLQQVFGDLSRAEETPGRVDPGTGYEQVERFLLGAVARLESQPENLRYIAVFNFLYAREGSSSRMRGALEQAAPGFYGNLAEIIRGGIADGSLRASLEPALTAAAMSNLIAAVTSRFSLLGAAVEDEYGQPVKALYQEICRNFLQGLRAKPLD